MTYFKPLKHGKIKHSNNKIFKNCNMRKLVTGLVLSYFTLSHYAYAAPAFKGINYSGEYLCKGTNEAIGEYEVVVTLKLNSLNSKGKFGVYDFNTETVNSVIYFGQAVADGNRLSLTFKLSKAPNAEYSTGIGEFKKLKGQRWGFSHQYYEPDNSGGNYGTEFCAMQKTFSATAKTKKIPKKT
jgi:hypothetical protein